MGCASVVRNKESTLPTKISNIFKIKIKQMILNTHLRIKLKAKIKVDFFFFHVGSSFYITPGLWMTRLLKKVEMRYIMYYIIYLIYTSLPLETYECIFLQSPLGVANKLQNKPCWLYKTCWFLRLACAGFHHSIFTHVYVTFLSFSH